MVSQSCWHRGLEDALPVWRAEDRRRRVRPLVSALFDEHIFLEPVLGTLRAERSLPTDLHDLALRLAKSRGNPTASDLRVRAFSLVNPHRVRLDHRRVRLAADKQIDVALGLRLAQAAVELAPEDNQIRDTLAWALFANGLLDEALTASEKALELAPKYFKKRYQTRLHGLRKSVAEARSTDAKSKNGKEKDR